MIKMTVFYLLTAAAGVNQPPPPSLTNPPSYDSLEEDYEDWSDTGEADEDVIIQDDVDDNDDEGVDTPN